MAGGRDAREKHRARLGRDVIGCDRIDLVGIDKDVVRATAWRARQDQILILPTPGLPGVEVLPGGDRPEAGVQLVRPGGGVALQGQPEGVAGPDLDGVVIRRSPLFSEPWTGVPSAASWRTSRGNAALARTLSASLAPAPGWPRRRGRGCGSCRVDRRGRTVAEPRIGLVLGQPAGVGDGREQDVVDVPLVVGREVDRVDPVAQQAAARSGSGPLQETVTGSPAQSGAGLRRDVVQPEIDVNQVERAVIDIGRLAADAVAVLVEQVAGQVA